MSREKSGEYGGQMANRFFVEREFGKNKRHERVVGDMKTNGEKNRIENGKNAVEVRKFMLEMFDKTDKDNFETLENYFEWLLKAEASYREYKLAKSGRIRATKERRDLLKKGIMAEKDVTCEFDLSGGPGGQNVQKRNTHASVEHTPTGIIAESQDQKTQGQNKNQAEIVLWNRVLEHLAKIEKSVYTEKDFGMEVERVFVKSIKDKYEKLDGHQKENLDIVWKLVFGRELDIKIPR